MLSVFDAKFTLKSLSIESNVPVGCCVDEFEKPGNNGVESVGWNW